jgi:hypothetical protein
VLAAAATTRIVTLPLSIVIMVVLVALLLAYHLAAAHRAALMINRNGCRSISGQPPGT